jgi:nucleoside phosphorylase
MSVTGIETNFNSLYTLLMKAKFLAPSMPAFGAKPTAPKVEALINKADPLLPAPFRAGYVTPLLDRADSIFARLGSNAFTLETLTGCIYQHADRSIQPQMNRFLAVISDLYLSFLNKSTRTNLQIELSERLPPLAVYQSTPTNGPFTIPCDMIATLTGGTIGVVSMPATFADHPLFFGSLAHETGGHDVIHADRGLMQQLRQQVYSLFPDSNNQWLALLWDYWMEEAAADTYGVLNMGPSFGFNLAMLLAVFIGQFAKPPARKPGLRNASGADETNAMDVHPTDLLRLALVQGVIQASPGLSQSTRDSYVNQIAGLTTFLANGANTIELTGQAAGVNGKSMNFQSSYPLDKMQDAARQVGAMIATAPLAALSGHSIQDIETWDDSDENAAVKIAARLQGNFPVVNAGDDAQLLAGFTLALQSQPGKYAAFTKLISDALDNSFANDPVWGPVPSDMMVIKPTRTLKNPEVHVDPYAEKIIDYNPLEEDAAASFGSGVVSVTLHAISEIPWPQNLAPGPDKTFTYNGQDAELPPADFVIFTWTSAEANAMAAALTPGSWAMPPHGMAGGWNVYANQWAAKYAGRFTPKSPAETAPYIGKFMPILIAGKKVLLFKSNFHLARDNASMPVKDMFKQVIEQTQAKLVITSGTAGAIGSKLALGDVMVANTTRFKLDGTFKNIPANGQTFTSGYVVPTNGQLVGIGNLIAPNAASIKQANTTYPNVVKPFTRNPQIFTAANPLSQVGEPPVVVTTDKFEFDNKQNSFSLQGLGAMIEMDDAVLGLAVQEMGSPTKWLAIRNASDPQMPTTNAGVSSDIYLAYGYWTSIVSALASWDCVVDFTG